jgi:hypothetical protein
LLVLRVRGQDRPRLGADPHPAGDLRQVSFQVGWDVYNGKRPGTLIAVCLDDNSSSRLVQVHD